MNNKIEYPESLGKWHHDIQITENLRTSDLSAPYDGNKFTSKKYLLDLLQVIFNKDLANKTVLDVACNAGGHLFELQSSGIKEGFGFDVRPLWISQANWLKENISLYDTSNLKFKVGNFDILNSITRKFDIALFNGIFYHLANPILNLQQVCNLTEDLIVVNTAYAPEADNNKSCLVLKFEPDKMEAGLSGIEAISWLPNSSVVTYVLKFFGFKYFKTLFKSVENKRLCIVASKLTPI
jgi:tRNA (mo5U34)-methyltransferase